ncbi:DUF2254 domain-containing protein [Rufibacter tibetensis]|uniref:DUF2254 domain-containing protein n=1 Tax=Rufibacter tibetensis TaxID=512763 RepID=A0A0P0CY45_9BACT|nr:DUF2254 domain-containing protein [Rufibacter tibetensis]ALI99609.1 hypothetical protein DC20_12285 [Rufibacter tibetensis]
MKSKIIQFVRRYYNKIINSIAFYPAVIALVFLLVSYVMLTIDFSPLGRDLKSRWDFLTLKDASTARTIAATIAAGILSLTVFSFSMVMILLNQAASNMSNRVLDSMIGNRFQQWVLGFYIGTIVYALFLLSTIRDIDSGVLVPALSVYLLILFTVLDIFLFIYFLHYITQSVKYETIINRIHRQTRQKLEQHCSLREIPTVPVPSFAQAQELKTLRSNYFQGFNQEGLLELCAQHNWSISFLYPVGTFLLEGVPFLKINAQGTIREEQEEQIRLLIDFYRGETNENNPYYGFKQLVEVALKALSPGVNDPGTAVLSLHVLVDLLAFRLSNHALQVMKDKEGAVRIVTKAESYKELFEKTLLPIWDYGKEDRIIRTEMNEVLEQLRHHPSILENKAIIEDLREKVRKKIWENEE